MAGLAFAGCVMRPEQTEGLYFVDDMLNRSEVRSDPTDGIVKRGAPLELTSFNGRAITILRRAGGKCRPRPAPWFRFHGVPEADEVVGNRRQTERSL